jgi:hypothetical protein
VSSKSFLSSVLLYALLEPALAMLHLTDALGFLPKIALVLWN